MEFESLLQDVKGSLINAKLGVEDDSIYMKCNLHSIELYVQMISFIFNIFINRCQSVQ